MSLKNQTVKFSIVIPCYNEELLIGYCLESLQKQTINEDYEIIVVDNNSTDKTAEVAKSYGVKVVTETNPGVCWARQAGTLAATGEIVISTDADTIFKEDWLQNIDNSFIKNPNIAAVCGPCKFFNAPWWGKVYPRFLFGGVYWYAKLFKRPFYITATNTAFKKSAWDGYDTSQTQGGDELNLLHQLRKKGRVIFTKNNAVYTSSRRLDHGLWYNVFVSLLYYYILAFYVNRIFKKQVIGSAPVYRPSTFKLKKGEFSRYLKSKAPKELGIMYRNNRALKKARAVYAEKTTK